MKYQIQFSFRHINLIRILNKILLSEMLMFLFRIFNSLSNKQAEITRLKKISNVLKTSLIVLILIHRV